MPPLPSPICVGCKRAPATKKGRCDECRKAYQRRAYLARKAGLVPTVRSPRPEPEPHPCPICELPTTRPRLCDTCRNQRSAARLNRLNSTKQARVTGWKDELRIGRKAKSAGPSEPPASKRWPLGVRTVRFVESVEADDPAKAAAVDAILARRRRLTAKGEV